MRAVASSFCRVPLIAMSSGVRTSRSAKAPNALRHNKGKLK